MVSVLLDTQTEGTQSSAVGHIDRRHTEQCCWTHRQKAHGAVLLDTQTEGTRSSAVGHTDRRHTELYQP